MLWKTGLIAAPCWTTVHQLMSVTARDAVKTKGAERLHAHASRWHRVSTAVHYHGGTGTVRKGS